MKTYKYKLRAPNGDIAYALIRADSLERANSKLAYDLREWEIVSVIIEPEEVEK